MSELQEKLKKIMLDIEKNIKNEKELEYVKTQIYNIYNLFLDEFEKIEEKYSSRMDSVFARCQIMEDRMKEVEDSINKIQTDIYVNDEEEDFSFDIECPYCNAEFTVDCSDELRDTVTCPECNNVIELDWNEDDDCSHGCHGCGESCEGHHHEDEDDDM